MTLTTLTRDAWLEGRKFSIGASEAAAVCGESPWLSPLELFARKLGKMPDPDLSDVEHVRWGNLLEPAIVAETADRLKLRLLSVAESAERLESPEVEIVGAVEGRQLFLRSHSCPWMVATLDGLAIDEAGALVSIEAKNTSYWQREDWEGGEAPVHYLLQVAHQLAVAAPVARGVLAGLVGGNKLRIVPPIERAAAPIEELRALEADFWRRLQTGEPPRADHTESSLRALKALHPDDNGESVTLPLEFAAMREEIARLEVENREREERIDALKIQIREAIGSATFGVLPDGSGTYSLKTQERGKRVVKASKFRTLRFSKGKSK